MNHKKMRQLMCHFKKQHVNFLKSIKSAYIYTRHPVNSKGNNKLTIYLYRILF